MYMNKHSVNIQNARHGKYLAIIKQIKQHGICPFCPPYLSIYHKKPIVRRGKYWLVTENMYPYKNTRHHFLFIHKTHIHSLSQLSNPAWKELLGHGKWLTRKYRIPGGMLFVRFGNPLYTGSSVKHLHAQMTVAKRGKPVITRA